MEYTAQFTYDCIWRVDGEKRVCTGGHESYGYPWYYYQWKHKILEVDLYISYIEVDLYIHYNREDISVAHPFT